MVIINGILSILDAHPVAGSIVLGIGIAGAAYVGKAVVDNAGTAATKLIDKGGSFSYTNSNFGIALNQPIPAQKNSLSAAKPENKKLENKS